MYESENDLDQTPIDTMDPVARTPVDCCGEAELIATTLSGGLTGPISLAERVQEDLYRIRTDWADAIPQVAFEFDRLMGEISVEVDSTTASAIQGGSYTAWDSLNELYGFDSRHTYEYHPSEHFRMYFTGCQNPARLALAYRELDGFIRASTPMRWYRGMDQLFVTEVADTLFYIFSEDFADSVYECDVVGGCGGYAYDVFSTIGADIEYHGHLGRYGAAGFPESLPEPWRSRIRDAWDLWAGRDVGP
jgi:hypothetical protein